MAVCSRIASSSSPFPAKPVFLQAKSVYVGKGEKRLFANFLSFDAMPPAISRRSYLKSFGSVATIPNRRGHMAAARAVIISLSTGQTTNRFYF